ncbi:MAG: hypothetical protein K0S71_1432 [Clostridia bacterium]|jgi:prepilin-type N-terminal cleavage/methylation domain-containing protein|nr:hypothetical protein [Clostridia bacterium]
MKQKGFSLLEVILVMLILSIGTVCVHTHTLYVEKMKFDILVKEVEKGIKSAQYMANITGREYNVLCTEKKVYIRPGYKKAVYVFDMGKNVVIPRDITGKQISFNGRMAPAKGGTILLINTALKKEARITIRVATGKTTIYFNKL